MDAVYEENPVWKKQMPPMFYNCEVDGVMNPVYGDPNYPAYSPGKMEAGKSKSVETIQLTGRSLGRKKGWYDEEVSDNTDVEINSLEARLRVLQSKKASPYQSNITFS